MLQGPERKGKKYRHLWTYCALGSGKWKPGRHRPCPQGARGLSGEARGAQGLREPRGEAAHSSHHQKRLPGGGLAACAELWRMTRTWLSWVFRVDVHHGLGGPLQGMVLLGGRGCCGSQEPGKAAPRATRLFKLLSLSCSSRANVGEARSLLLWTLRAPWTTLRRVLAPAGRGLSRGGGEGWGALSWHWWSQALAVVPGVPQTQGIAAAF